MADASPSFPSSPLKVLNDRILIEYYCYCDKQNLVCIGIIQNKDVSRYSPSETRFYQIKQKFVNFFAALVSAS